MTTTTRRKRVTHGPQVAAFFETYLRHRKGIHATQPFVLEPFQRTFLDEFYEREKGRRVYKYGYLGIPRGNGKTPTAAGLGLYELLVNKDSPDVFNVAASKEQARLLLDFARGFVEDHEKLGGPQGRGWIEPSRNFLRCYENHGIMRVLAASGLNLHGLNPSAELIDELHAMVDSSQEEVFNAMLTGLHKRPDSFMLAITTAGYDKETILGRAYDESMNYPDGEDLLDGCLRIRRDRENGVLVYWYGIPEAKAEDWMDEKLWRHSNPASFIDVDTLRKQLHAPGFHDLDFQRLHLNMWTSTREAWLPSGTWNGLKSTVPIPDGAPIYAAVDVGYYHDTTAVAWAHRLEDGRVAVRTRVWGVKPEVPHDVFVAGGRMRLALVDDFLRELAAKYQLEEVSFDPMGFGAEADRLHDDGVAPFLEFGQGTSAMAEAYSGFYQACREGKLTHNGDPVLAAHVEGTAAELTERGWRIRKLRSKVNDACVAAVMARYRCIESGGPSVYETNGLFTVDLMGRAIVEKDEQGGDRSERLAYDEDRARELGIDQDDSDDSDDPDDFDDFDDDDD